MKPPEKIADFAFALFKVLLDSSPGRYPWVVLDVVRGSILKPLYLPGKCILNWNYHLIPIWESALANMEFCWLMGSDTLMSFLLDVTSVSDRFYMASNFPLPFPIPSPQFEAM